MRLEEKKKKREGKRRDSMARVRKRKHNQEETDQI